MTEGARESVAVASRRESAAVQWLAAARPRTLPAAVVPVLVGLALAGRSGPIDVGVAALTLVTTVLIQIGTNLANDYYDFVAGADREDRVGPRRITQAGVAAPATVRAAAFAVLALAAAGGAGLVAIGGWPIALVGIASLAAAVAYTGGPFPLAYHGLGDVFVFLFFGVIAVNGTVFLQTGGTTALSFLVSLPVACLATAILVVNNLRDLATDARAGKRTVAVRIGAAATRLQYLALVAAPFLLLPFLVRAIGTPALVVVAALPFAVREVRALYARTGAGLNASLAGTARLHVVVGLLLALGLAA